MERDHQKVEFNGQYIVLQEAISNRAQLIKRKHQLEKELRAYENAVSDISCAIEYACDHDWLHETEYSCGEKDTWSTCKICGMVKGGRH